MNNNKNILILDNDGTLSKFKNGDFKNTIGNDLKINIKDYVTSILAINEEQYFECIRWIKENNYQLSEGFEILGINRKNYFYETWKNLEPSKYLIDRGNTKLRELIEKKYFMNIMITGAAKVWFYNTIEFLGYDIKLFDKIYTGEDFYNKNKLNESIFKDMTKERIRNSIAIGDEKNDYSYLDKIGGMGIDINNSIYK